MSRVATQDADNAACVHSSSDQDEATAFLPDNHDTRLSMDLDGHAWGQVVAGFRQAQASRMADYWSDDGRKKPRFSGAKASEKYAKAKDVERHCLSEFGDLTTVWFSFVVPEKTSEGEWLNPEDHAGNFDAAHSATYRNLKRRVQEYNHAGVWLRAARETGYTHLHMAVWVDGELPEEHFHPVVDSFVRNAPDATKEANPYSKAIRVNHVSPDDIGTPDHEDADLETDDRRGATTAFPREIGGNIDALGTDADIRDTENDAASPEVMHASLCFELDMRIWQPFGSFTDYADSVKARRDDTAEKKSITQLTQCQKVDGSEKFNSRTKAASDRTRRNSPSSLLRILAQSQFSYRSIPQSGGRPYPPSHKERYLVRPFAETLHFFVQYTCGFHL